MNRCCWHAKRVEYLVVMLSLLLVVIRSSYYCWIDYSWLLILKNHLVVAAKTVRLFVAYYRPRTQLCLAFTAGSNLLQRTSLGSPNSQAGLGTLETTPDFTRKAFSFLDLNHLPSKEKLKLHELNMWACPQWIHSRSSWLPNDHNLNLVGDWVIIGTASRKKHLH